VDTPLDMALLRRFVLAVTASSLTLAAIPGCVVQERVVVARPAPPCPGAMWIEGHYGPRGRWHHGHWRCPGVVEVIEVE
jgi:hypothetical protein